MKHLSREDVTVAQLLRRARIIAVIGASPRADRHSHTVTHHLRGAGFDVIPIRSDGQDVDGMKSYARLEDIPVPVDIVVIFRNPHAALGHIAEAVDKGAMGIWLPPGSTSLAANKVPLGNATLLEDRCIGEDLRVMLEVLRHPGRLGLNFRRGRPHEDNRKNREETGYTANGGGGGIGGGGVRSRLDEKKMLVGKNSPRSGGPFKMTG